MIKFERIVPFLTSFGMNSIRIRKTVIWVTFLVSLSSGSFAQGITMEQTLDYINKKLGNGYTVDVNRGVIIARFSEGAEPFREDQVLYKLLDLTSMRYDASQRLFIINCKDGKDCVDRQLFIKKIQRDYGRFSLPVTLDAKGISGMKKAFEHMYRLIEDPKYKNSEPFE
jgi:hypothetical protein